MTRLLRAGFALLALSAILAGSAGAAPYRRTEELKFTHTQATPSAGSRTLYTGYVGGGNPGTVLCYATDSLVRNSVSNGTTERTDTLVFSIRDLAVFRSTSGALADSLPLFTFWMAPDPSSGIGTVAADSMFYKLHATIGGALSAPTAPWSGTGTENCILELASMDIFAKTFSFNGIFGSPPTTQTDVTEGLYDTFRLIIRSDAVGSYKFFVSYWAESTAPHQPLQN